MLQSAIVSIVLSLIPLTALAEPSPGASHFVVPYLVSGGVTLCIALLPLLARRFWFPGCRKFQRWLISCALAALFAVFVAPFIFVVLAIIIAGRTM